MSNTVYKSENGKTLIEDAYKEQLASGLTLGLTQKTVETTHGRTFVLEKCGPGKPPLVLLHGSMSNSASWIGVLSLYMQNFSVFCLDIPGEPGFSSPKRFSLKSDHPEQWLKSVLGELGLEKPFFLGMSLGGWYALNFAVRNPENVSALSVISTGGIAPQKYSFLFKALFFLMLGKKGQDLLNRAICRNAAVPKEILDYQTLVSKHFRPVREPLPLFSDKQLLKLTMPVQYLGGDQDVLLNTGQSVEKLSSLLPHAEACLLKDTGHVIIDQFKTTYDFLSRHIPVKTE